MKSAVLFSVAALTACLDLDADTVQEDPATNTPKIATNALTPFQIWYAQPTFNPAKLDAANLSAMAQTDEGRTSLNYLVGCALNQGQNVTTNVGGTNYTFYGGVGIASGWTASALTITQQRWVTSCVLSRLNEFGTTVTISMRGSSSALNLATGEAAQYDEQEGAFFGNLFPGRDFYVASCRGSGGTLPSRTCATSTGNCGIDWVGDCANVCTLTGGYMTGCAGDNGTTYNEAVTVHLDL